MRTLTNPWRDDERERGSISIVLVVGAVAMIILVGLAADVGGKVHTLEHARDVARQAARAGGQQLVAPAAIRGEGVQADPYAAQQAAQAYLSGAGVAGSATVINGTTVRVTTTETYSTKFLNIIGIGSFTVHGDAESRIVRSAGGVEQ